MAEEVQVWLAALAPLFTGVFLCVALLLLRVRARERWEARTRQLRHSAELFRAHSAGLEQVLAEHRIPDLVKMALLDIAGGLNDPDVVLAAGKVLSRPVPLPIESEDPIAESLGHLAVDRPDLAAACATVALNGFLAALLRWPKTAHLFEDVSTRMAVDPRRNVDVVLTASHLRPSNLPFGLRPAAA